MRAIAHKHCVSCGGPIFFARLPSGATMPLDGEPDPSGNVIMDGQGRGRVLTNEELTALPPETPRYLSHFAKCPFASRHRKRDGRTVLGE